MHSIDIFLQDRELIELALSGLSDQGYFYMPPSFDNNIAWNLGHIIVTQQALHYRLSGLPTLTSRQDVIMFRTGSSPAGWSENPDISRLLDLLAQTGPKLKDDYEAKLFADFQPYTTSTGIDLQTIEAAVAFNNFHEGLHLGTILALRNFVKNFMKVTDKIALRPASAADFDSLWQLHRNELRPSISRIWDWDEAWQLAYFRQRFDPDARQIIIYEGQEAGSVGIEWQEEALYMAYLAVKADYQGRGIGTAVIEELNRQAGERGLPLTLSVLKGNPAKALYDRLGFFVIKEEDTRYWMVLSPPL